MLYTWKLYTNIDLQMKCVLMNCTQQYPTSRFYFQLMLYTGKCAHELYTAVTTLTLWAHELYSGEKFYFDKIVKPIGWLKDMLEMLINLIWNRWKRKKRNIFRRCYFSFWAEYLTVPCKRGLRSAFDLLYVVRVA